MSSNNLRHTIYDTETSPCTSCLLRKLADDHILAAEALLQLLRTRRTTIRGMQDGYHKDIFASNIAELGLKIILGAVAPAEILQAAVGVAYRGGPPEEYLVRSMRKLHQDHIGEIDRENFFWASYGELANWYECFGDKLPMEARAQMEPFFRKRGSGT